MLSPGLTLSTKMFDAAMVFARSAADEPTSSRMFCAACPSVCEPGRPDTELAAPRAMSWLRSREAGGRAMGVALRRGEVVGMVEKGRRSAMGARRRAKDNMAEGKGRGLVGLGTWRAVYICLYSRLWRTKSVE